MNMKRYYIFAALALIAAVSCRKEPSASDFDGEYLVYTSHSDEVSDFSGYSTFTVADSLLYIEGDRGEMVLNSWTQTVKSQYISQMEAYGYTYVDTGKDDNNLTADAPSGNKADLGINISYVVSTDFFTSYIPSSPYWWDAYPGYWYPGYWGNWGSWYYSFPVTYSYSTHSLLTSIADLTSEQGEDKALPVVWNSYIDGEIGDSYADKARFTRAIEQSFEQSEYLDNTK